MKNRVLSRGFKVSKVIDMSLLTLIVAECLLMVFVSPLVVIYSGYITKSG